MIGHPAFEVVTIFKSPLSRTSQAHPEPNCPIALAVNSSLNLSTLPKAFVKADSTDAGIAPWVGVDH